MDYSKTLNLPEMNLPMKADFAEIEPDILSIWSDLNVYERRQRLNKGNPKFLVHNPPRPAYGHVHIDDAANMIMKDIIVKYNLMRGFNVPQFPNWNCYGSAIEREALQSLEGEGNEARQSEVWKLCRRLSLDYIALQKEQYQRLGVFSYWDKAVSTLDSKYRSRMIGAFGDLYKAGYLCKVAKPTRWCIKCQTDLVEAEIEYRNHKLLSLHVKFPVIYGLEELGADVYIVVWTNTPWTLSANAAVVVHPDHDYVAVQHKLQENDEILIMAESAMEDVMKEAQSSKMRGSGRLSIEPGASDSPYRVVKKIKGLELYKMVYAHPFLDRDSEVLLDRNVSLTRGTGCVHTTPRGAQEDYSVDQEPDPESISAVDEDGRLTEQAGQFCGLNAFESSKLISLELDKRGCLLASEPVEQPYPHCSYCKKPIIVRFADKWIFRLSTGNLRQRIPKMLKEFDWLPHSSKNRLSYAIANRSDWDVSRRRIWGIPTPVFYCSKCGFQVDTLRSINASRSMISRRGVNRWLTEKPSDILSDDVVCSRCGGKDFRWETDILDVDFISAMSYKASSSSDNDPLQIADICLGTNGQSEKCLQFSVLPAIAIEGSLPFKSVLIHGAVVDEDGKKISTSGDGAPSIQNLLNEFGADILRLWITSMDCKKNLKISHSRLESVARVYQRVRNVCRFLLGNLSGYDPESDRVDHICLQEIDRWALHRLAKFIDRATKALENRKFHIFYRSLYDFCSVDMSSRYLSIVKRRLYVFPQWSSSRRAVQTVIYEVLSCLTRLTAPVLSFMAEELWGQIPSVKEDFPSVYLSQWPGVNEDFLDDELESRWDCLLKIRSEIYKSLEKVCQEEGISGPSQASVVLYASSPDIYDLLDRYIDDLETIFMVSKVRLMPPDVPIPDEIRESDSVEGLAIETRRATGEKCERCWMYSDTVGTNEQYPTLCHQCIAILEGGTYYI